MVAFIQSKTWKFTKKQSFRTCQFNESRLSICWCTYNYNYSEKTPGKGTFNGWRFKNKHHSIFKCWERLLSASSIKISGHAPAGTPWSGRPAEITPVALHLIQPWLEMMHVILIQVKGTQTVTFQIQSMQNNFPKKRCDVSGDRFCNGFTNRCQYHVMLLQNVLLQLN